MKSNRVYLWLSAAPEEDATPLPALKEFVQLLANCACHNGDVVVHGMQPVVTAWLKEILEPQSAFKKRESLVLVVSRFFSRRTEVNACVQNLRQNYYVYETPVHSSDERDPSLALMRDVLANKSNAFVAVGGKINDRVKEREGVTDEIERALKSNLPCYILGGFGGAARLYIDRHPKIVTELRNGLTPRENLQLAKENNPHRALGLVAAGLRRLPIGKVNIRWSGPFRLLALDGGGIKGVYSAAVLASLEDYFKCQVSECFDMVAGTSTGGLLATGISAGLPASRILEFYKKYGRDIFPRRCLARRVFRFISSGSRYDGEVLRNVLTKLLSKDGKLLTMAEACCRLFIPSFDVVAGKPIYFTTPHAKYNDFDANLSLVDVAMATSAAPLYFPVGIVKTEFASNKYMDGALVANAPVLAAILHAKNYLGVDPGQISVLHIGTTTTPTGIKDQSDWFYNLRNIKGTAKAFLNAQEYFMHNEAKKMVGDLQYVKIDDCRDNDEFSLSDASIEKINSLASLGERAIRDQDTISKLNSLFFNGIKVIDWRSFQN